MKTLTTTLSVILNDKGYCYELLSVLSLAIGVGQPSPGRDIHVTTIYSVT